jgi:CO/xanthine dehydrogenase Mo-binding subunit
MNKNAMNDDILESSQIIGQRFPRVDARDKVTGRTRYVSDLKVQGALFGKVLHSPYPHARIINIDTSRAQRLPGVRAVVTHADSPGVLYGSYNSGVKDEFILAKDRVRYVGDEVAAVAAIDSDIAMEALSLIQVDYEPLPGCFHPEEAMVEGAVAIHPVDHNICSHRITVRGDPDAGFLQADLVLEDRFETDLQIHAYLEPVACIADYDSQGRFHLWAPLQNPSWSRIIFAEAMNLPISHFHCVQTPIGGAFGGKLEQKLYLIGFLLARKARAPVRLENTREEEFQTSMPRVPMVIELKMGMRKDGLITAKAHRIIADNGAYAKYAPAVLNLGTYRVDGLYRIQNVRNECILVYTNRPPTSAFRGFGNPQITFAVESMIDMLIRDLGLDPLEIRIKNSAQPGDVNVHGFRYTSCGFKESLEEVGRMMNYHSLKTDRGPDEGVGLSGTSHVCGNRSFFPLFDGSTAFVRIDEGGNVRVIPGETDVGQGLLTTFAMIVGEELGVSLDQIKVDEGDTDLSAFGLGTWGDRATFIGGNAVRLAAREAKNEILKVAADMLEANPADLVIKNNLIFVKGAPVKCFPFEEVAAHAVYTQGGAPVMTKGTFIPDSERADSTLYGNISATYAFGAQGCKVRVDRQTGEVEILEFYAAHDVGRAINPMACEGQIEGSVAQGIGYGLLEKVHYKDGVMLNPNFLHYRIPTSLDVPQIFTALIEPIDPAGPYGAKGVAEPAMTPTAVCIANAIYDAVGVRIKELPATPQKILTALKEKEQAR